MLRKYCEIEICPWHLPSNKMRERGVHAKFKQNTKRKVQRKKTESKLFEKCNQNEEQEIDASQPAKTIPSENEPNEDMVKNDTDRTKDKSEDINESPKKEMVPGPSEKRSKSIKTTEQRPKTAPPIQHDVVVSQSSHRKCQSFSLSFPKTNDSLFFHVWRFIIIV